PLPPSSGDAPQQQSSINALTAQLNLTLTPQLTQALQEVISSDNGSESDSTMAASLSVRSRVTVQLPAGVFSEASSSALQAASQLLNLQVTQRLLALPLAIPPGSVILAAGVCSAALVNSIEGDDATATKLQLISIVAAAASVPSSWVSVACLPAPDASQLQSRRLATATRPGHLELPAGQALRQLQASTGACSSRGSNSSSSPSLVTSIITQGSQGGRASNLAAAVVEAVSAWQASLGAGLGATTCSPDLNDVVLSTSADVVLTVVGGAEALAANAPLLCQGITDLAAQAATALLASGTTAQVSNGRGGCSLSSLTPGTATILADGSHESGAGPLPNSAAQLPLGLPTAVKIIISVTALGGVAMFASLTLLVMRRTRSWSGGETAHIKPESTMHAKMAAIMFAAAQRRNTDPRRAARIMHLIGVREASRSSNSDLSDRSLQVQHARSARAARSRMNSVVANPYQGASVMPLPAWAAHDQSVHGATKYPPSQFAAAAAQSPPATPPPHTPPHDSNSQTGQSLFVAGPSHPDDPSPSRPHSFSAISASSQLHAIASASSLAQSIRSSSGGPLQPTVQSTSPLVAVRPPSSPDPLGPPPHPHLQQQGGQPRPLSVTPFSNSQGGEANRLEQRARPSWAWMPADLELDEASHRTYPEQPAAAGQLHGIKAECTSPDSARPADSGKAAAAETCAPPLAQLADLRGATHGLLARLWQAVVRVFSGPQPAPSHIPPHIDPVCTLRQQHSNELHAAHSDSSSSNSSSRQSTHDDIICELLDTHDTKAVLQEALSIHSVISAQPSCLAMPAASSPRQLPVLPTAASASRTSVEQQGAADPSPHPPSVSPPTAAAEAAGPLPFSSARSPFTTLHFG
ncbi:hypothetical protein V8C86DRAFT_2608356, partial [Haematococcus lacustris]